MHFVIPDFSTPAWDYACPADSGPDPSVAEALCVDDGACVCAEREG